MEEIQYWMQSKASDGSFVDVFGFPKGITLMSAIELFRDLETQLNPANNKETYRLVTKTINIVDTDSDCCHICGGPNH